MTQPTDKLDVTLEARQWNDVMAIIARAPIPYEIVAPLLAEIQRQCAAQAQPLALAPREDKEVPR